MSPNTLKTLFDTGRSFLSKSNYKEALKVFLEIEKLSENVTDKNFLAELFASTGVAHIYLSNHGNAVEYLGKARILFHELKNYDREGDCLSQIARTQWSFFGSAAIETLFEEIDLCLKHGMNEKLASCYCNICACYLALGNFKDAAYYGNKAAEIAEEAKNNLFLAKIYINLGNIELEKKDYDEAEAYYRKGLECAELADDESGIAINYDNLGYIISAQKGKIEDALKYVVMAQEIHAKRNDNNALAQSYQTESYVYKNYGDFTSAEKCALKTLELAEKYNFKDILKSSYLNLYEIYKHQKRFKEAYNIYAEYAALKDEIFDESSKGKNEYLSVIHKIEIEKSESDILKQKNDELSALNSELNNLNKEKNKFLNIAAKDLSNPLNSISLLSSTLKSFYDKYSPEDFNERLQKIESDSKKMQEIVESLLLNVRSNTSDD